MATCNLFRLLIIIFLYISPAFSTSFQIVGEGLHRQLNITLSEERRGSNALLSWQITPDFYVDVYELQRKKFQFRVDDGESKFIDIGTANALHSKMSCFQKFPLTRRVSTLSRAT